MPDNRPLSAAPDASGGGAATAAPGSHTPSKAVDLPAVPKLMAGKRGLVMGVANERSIAWGIAQALHGAGAEMAFTHQGAAVGKGVLLVAEKLGSSLDRRRGAAKSRRRVASTGCSSASAGRGAGSVSWSTPSPSPTRRS